MDGPSLSVLVHVYRNTIAPSPCHIWLNGSTVWLAVQGGVVWLPRVPAVTLRHSEQGWGLLITIKHNDSSDCGWRSNTCATSSPQIWSRYDEETCRIIDGNKASAKNKATAQNPCFYCLICIKSSTLRTKSNYKDYLAYVFILSWTNYVPTGLYSNKHKRVSPWKFLTKKWIFAPFCVL